MTSRHPRVRRGRRSAAAVVPVVLVGLTLLASACSSSGMPAGANSPGTTPTTTPFQGAVGQMAALTPPSMEVQDPQTGQTTVTWTSSTTFDQTVTVAASAVKAGDCVVVSGTPSSPGSSSSPITARTLSIVATATGGSCASAGAAGGPTTFGGGSGRFFGSGGAGGFTRTSTPGGSIPSGTFPQMASAVGTVSAVTSSGFVVHGTERNGIGRRTASSSTTTTTQPAVTDITVTTSSTTAATEVQSASASALSVGACVTARGPSDSSGAVTATAVSIRPPVNGQCFSGFGAGRFGGGTSSTGGANA